MVIVKRFTSVRGEMYYDISEMQERAADTIKHMCDSIK